MSDELEWNLPEEDTRGDEPRPPSRRRKVMMIAVVAAMVVAVVGLLVANILPGFSSSSPPPSPTQVAMKELTDHGLSREQAAGVIGNLQFESGLNPAAVQTQGPGRGLAMWQESGPAWQDVLARAQRLDTPPTNLKLQLDVLWDDLSQRHPDALAKLKQMSGPESSVAAFANFYLHVAPSAEHTFKQRYDYAEQALRS
jgi:hypothetical protein